MSYFSGKFKISIFDMSMNISKPRLQPLLPGQCSTSTFHGTHLNAHFEEIRTSNTQKFLYDNRIFYLSEAWFYQSGTGGWVVRQNTAGTNELKVGTKWSCGSIGWYHLLELPRLSITMSVIDAPVFAFHQILADWVLSEQNLSHPGFSQWLALLVLYWWP